MSTIQLIYVVLALYYLMGAYTLCQPASLLILSDFRGRLRWWAASSGVRIGRSSYLTAAGLFPWSRGFVVQFSPVAFTSTGVRLGQRFELPPHLPLAQPEQEVPYADLDLVAVQDCDLRIRSRPPVNEVQAASEQHPPIHFASKGAAAAAKAVLTALKNAGQQQIAKLLRDRTAQRLNVGAIRERQRIYEKVTGLLRQLGTISFLYVFVVVPAGYLAHQNISWLAWDWWRVLAAYLGLLVLTEVLYFRAHRRLYPHARAARFGKMLGLLVSPAEMMLAARMLGRDIFEGFEPMAVAQVLLPEAELTRLASSAYRAHRHPTGGSAELSEVLTAEFAQALEALGMQYEHPQSSDTPPAEPGCAFYCPRCTEQYTRDDGCCAACPGIKLAELPGRS